MGTTRSSASQLSKMCPTHLPPSAGFKALNSSISYIALATLALHSLATFSALPSHLSHADLSTSPTFNIPTGLPANTDLTPRRAPCDPPLSTHACSRLRPGTVVVVNSTASSPFDPTKEKTFGLILNLLSSHSHPLVTGVANNKRQESANNKKKKEQKKSSRRDERLNSSSLLSELHQYADRKGRKAATGIQGAPSLPNHPKQQETQGRPLVRHSTSIPPPTTKSITKRAQLPNLSVFLETLHQYADLETWKDLAASLFEGAAPPSQPNTPAVVQHHSTTPSTSIAKREHAKREQLPNLAPSQKFRYFKEGILVEDGLSLPNSDGSHDTNTNSKHPKRSTAAPLYNSSRAANTTTTPVRALSLTILIVVIAMVLACGVCIYRQRSSRSWLRNNSRRRRRNGTRVSLTEEFVGDGEYRAYRDEEEGVGEGQEGRVEEEGRYDEDARAIALSDFGFMSTVGEVRGNGDGRRVVGERYRDEHEEAVVEGQGVQDIV